MIQRNTVQRQIILETLKRLSTHPTIEEIYAAIHVDHPSISKTTVYRDIRQFTASGIIRQIPMQDVFERYDGRAEPHYHFKCRICGGIFDIFIDYLSDVNDSVKEKYNYQVDEHDIIFKGVCEKCKQESEKNN